MVECRCRQCGGIEKSRRMVATWKNTRRSSTSTNMLSLWWNPNLNKKSPITLYPALHLANEMRCKSMDVQVGKSVRNDTGKGGWTTGLSKLSEKSTVFDSQEWSLTGTQTTSQESTHVNSHPPRSNEGYDSFREDPYRMGRVVSSSSSTRVRASPWVRE